MNLQVTSLEMKTRREEMLREAEKQRLIRVAQEAKSQSRPSPRRRVALALLLSRQS